MVYGVRPAFWKENGVMRLFKVAVVTILFLSGVKVATSGDVKEPEVLPTPVMRNVTPEAVKAGEAATVSGEYLDKSRVAEVFLTSGQIDIKLEILAQSATAIKFKVPENAAPGRYNMMVMLVGAEPKLIEEPARLTVQ
jgi:hypothetical protein